MEKRKMKKIKKKIKYKHVLLWCARSGCDVGAHGAVVRRSLGWLGRSDHEIGFAVLVLVFINRWVRTAIFIEYSKPNGQIPS